MSWARILGWAVFLGVSWTWCIGMYLPVLLVRDFGVWGWVVFAIPNVIGAAAMGWVIRDAESSRRFVRDHGPACDAFSVVTLAFQCFFLAWIFRGFAALAWWDDAALFAVLLALAMRWRAAAAVTVALALIVSTFAAAWLYADHGLSFRWYASWFIPLNGGQTPAVLSKSQIACLGLVCLFGFSLCPYLDLTFHQARQATTPAGGRVAFAVGFGVIFLAMIVFTLAYNGLVYDWRIPAAYLAIPLGNHFVYQIGAKLVLHSRALKERHGLFYLAIPAIACAISFAIGLAAFDADHGFHGLRLFEVFYRLFMAFYGLIFPAYVWIVIYRKAPLMNCAIAVALAAPMFWVAFIERDMVWVLLGVGVVLLAPLLRPRIALRTAA